MFQVNQNVFGISCYSKDITNGDDCLSFEKNNGFIIKGIELNFNTRLIFYISEFIVLKYGKLKTVQGIYLKAIDKTSIEKYNKYKLKYTFVKVTDINTCIFDSRLKAESKFERYIDLTSQRIGSSNNKTRLIL